jgi:glycosyltransferase involved in cell wall biosynthesis
MGDGKRLTVYGTVAMGLFYGIMTASKALGMDSSNSLYYGMFGIACICLLAKYVLYSFSLKELAWGVVLAVMGLACLVVSGDMTLLLLVMTIMGLGDCDFRDMVKVAFIVRLVITSVMIVGSFLGVFDQGETAQVTTSFQDILVYDFGYSTANNAYINIFLLVALLLYFGYDRITWKWFALTLVFAMLMYTFTNSRTGTMLFFAMWFFIFCEKFLQGKKLRPVFFGALRWMPLICAVFSLCCTVLFRMDGSYATEYINRIFSGRLNITHQYYEALGVSLLPRSSSLMDSLRGIGFIDNIYMSVFFHNGLIVGLVIMGLIVVSNGRLYRGRCYRELVFVATFAVYGMMEEFPLNPVVNPFIMLTALVVYNGFTVGGSRLGAPARRVFVDGGKQNVLVVHNHYRIAGGEDTVAAGEAQMLKDNGHRVVVYERSNDELDSLNAFRRLLLPLTSIFSVKTYREVSHLIEYYDIDVVHVHNTLTMVSPSVYYAAFHMGVPVVQTMHNFRLLCPGGSFYREDAGEYGMICEDCAIKGLQCSLKHRCYRGSLAQTLVSAAILKLHRLVGTYRRLNYICLTDFNRSKLMMLNDRGRKVVDSGRVFIKPNMVRDLRQELDLGHMEGSRRDGAYYVYVGRLEALKGIELIINAFILMPDVRLKVLGDGPKMSWAQEVVREHGADNIELLGRLSGSEYAGVVNGARAIITASQCYETYGMAIGEAYSLGVPAIVGNMGNLADMVIEGVTGIHYEYDAVDSPDGFGLVQAVRSLEGLGGDELDNMGINARRFYEERLTPDRNYGVLKNIYDKCTI